MKLSSFFFGLLFLLTTNLFAQSNNEPKQVPPVMYEFLGELMRMQPYIVSKKRFTDPKNSSVIAEHLLKISEISKRLNHSERLNTSGFRPNAKAVQDHLDQLSAAFSKSNKDYAFRLLHASLDGCGNCHSQVPAEKNQWHFKDSELVGTPVEKGDFLYTVRHYKEALEYYTSAIRQTGKTKLDPMDIEHALERKLFIYVRSLRDRVGAVQSLSEDLKSPQLTQAMQKEVKGWIDTLNKIPVQKSPKYKAGELETLASTTLQPFLKGARRFEPTALVNFLYISGLIYQFIDSEEEKTVTPGLLYWLAVSDMQLNKSMYFSMSDDFFKECIRRFPESPTAQKCFTELENHMVEAYTGSDGTSLPADVKQELKGLKNLLNAEKASKKN